MEENLKMQLQREFELELLRNHKLKLVNFEHDDSDYIGMNIVDELRSTVVQDLFYLVEKISYISAKNLLKSGVIKNFIQYITTILLFPMMKIIHCIFVQIFLR